MAQQNPNKGKAPLKAKRGAPVSRENRSACLPAERAWLGFEYLKPLDGGSLNVIQSTATAQFRNMCKHEKELSDSCLWLSLLAHARGDTDCDFVGRQKWGEVKLEGMTRILQDYSRKTKTTLVMWYVEEFLGSFGLEEGPHRFRYVGSDRDEVHIALIRMGAGYHMLPLAAPRLKARVPIDRRPVPEPAQAEQALPVDVATSSSEVVQIQPPVQGSDHAAPNPATEVVADPPQEVSPTIPVEAYPGVPEYLDFFYDGAGPQFDGIHSPPGCLNWRAGWWPSVGTKAVSCMDILPRLRPDVASATLDYALAHLDSVLYLPVEIRAPLYVARRRIVSDGHKRAQFFLAGDVVRAGRSTYRAEPVRQWGVDLLKLVCNTTSFSDSVSQAFRGLIPFVNRCKSVVLETNGEDPVSEEAKTAVRWVFNMHTVKDTVEIAALAQVKNRAAAQGYSAESDQPDEAAEWVRRHRQLYPSSDGVGGPYKWGYCFSCGKQLPGTFKHRLCSECTKGQNSGLGRMVADGLQVTSHANPIVYPGVVNTNSRHPMLKKAYSFATDQNFRPAPSASRRCFPSPR